MARIKLEMPLSYPFACQLPVRITDLNYGNHVGNDRMLAFAQEARAAYFASLGYGELNLAGMGSIIADAIVLFKAEAFYGDVLHIEVAPADFHKYGFDLLYRITNQHGKEVAHIKTGILCFNYEARKIALLPAEVQQQMKA